MIESEMNVAAPALAAGACAFVFIAFLYTKLAKFETGTDIGVPVLDELSLQVGPPIPHPPTHARARAQAQAQALARIKLKALTQAPDPPQP